MFSRLLLACGLAHAARLPVSLRDGMSDGVEGRYIVQLCDETHRVSITKHIASRHALAEAPQFRATVQRHLARLRKLPMLVLQGASREAMSELAKHEHICKVEPVRRTHAIRDNAKQTKRRASKAGASKAPATRLSKASKLSKTDASTCYQAAGVEVPDCACHESCDTCGYYSFPDEYNDCIQCADGSEVQVQFADGTGSCIDALEIAAPYGVWWHLDRIDQASLPLDGDAAHDYTGMGVDVFIMDTGLDAGHAEFAPGTLERKVANVASFVEGKEWAYNTQWGWEAFPTEASWLENNDGDGHGTHVSGTVGGNSVGVAPGANIYMMKVLGDDGSGFSEWTLSAYDSIAGLIETGQIDAQRTIASLSLGSECGVGSASFCSENTFEAMAIEALSDLGVKVVVAAGNEADDACFYSPAASSKAVTVGATNVEDGLAGFSNYGSCLDIVAPGVNIASAAADTKSAYENASLADYLDDDLELLTTLSGTSMATPVVSGALALYTEMLGGSTAGLSALLTDASKEKVAQSVSDCETNELLVYLAFSDKYDSEYVAPDCSPPADRPGWPQNDGGSYSYSYSLSYGGSNLDLLCLLDCEWFPWTELFAGGEFDICEVILC
ncbi:peptidase S8/S53 domain-containing protein [Pelagophyceae sp. CCMP2097]|nr:peptidase S8/S53 domain-containing protein [Pelagophyceae sp. CCMP2097]